MKDSLPLCVDGRTGEDDIVELWRARFQTIANCVDTNVNEEFVVNALRNARATDNDVVTVHELKHIVANLKNNKAIGNDGIPGEVFKYASPRLLTIMCILLSSCLLMRKLPNELMKVVLIPLLKCRSKDPSDTNNYRPIAIATSMSKVLEQVLLVRLQDYLHTADSQFGFKAAHGTEMAIFALKQTVEYYKSKNSPVYLCFLDAKKAFDRVNHWTLFRKLLERGTPPHLVELLLLWYREQDFVVKWGGTLSSSFKCINGIRQGGQLSPLLYVVYTDELNSDLASAKVGCYVGDQCMNAISYADDMVLLAPTVTALQKLVSVCDRFAEPHDVLYNTDKTVCMLVRPKSSRCKYATEVNLNNVGLQYVNEFRYLGHIVTDDFRDDKDIAKQFRRQNAVGNMLIRRFSFATPDVKIQLFKTHCYPIYSNALWCNYRQYSMNQLTVSYSTTFKRLMDRPRFTSSSAVFAEHQTDHIKVVLRKGANSLMNRVLASSNALISAICNSDAYRRSGLLERWDDMLYTR